MLPAFSQRHIQGLCPAIWRKALELTDCLEKEAYDPDGNANDKIIDMKEWSSRVTLDIIGVTGMDYDFQSLQTPDSELIKVYSKLFAPPPKNFRYFAQIARFIGPRTIAALPLKFNKMLQINKAFVRNAASEIIDQRRQRMMTDKSEQDKSDILGVMLRSEADFSNQSLVDHMMNFLAAGHETTSSTLQWLLIEMCRHQHIQDRLRAEIHKVLPKECFSKDTSSARPVTTEIINELHYTKAVCNEVLRCHPAAPQMIRISEYKDSYLQGEFIPKGTKILVPPQAINYDPKLWGPDAANFNPDRWMAPGQATSGGATTAYAQMTFIHGPHSCIGKDFTKVELYMLTACLFGSFKFRSQDPDREIGYNQGITVTPSGGVPVYLQKVL